MNDYERVALIINYLDEHHADQPGLEELARRAGLSTFHFHRLFSKWAGTTPKDFLQCLTFSHAKQLLREGESVLEAAMCAGLSGPGRLHDLCVSLEAVSPGELKAGGEGLEIRYGFAPTPFGDWLAAETSRGVCRLSFLDESGPAKALAELKSDWPNARFSRNDTRAVKLSSTIFPQSNQIAPLKAFVRGTPFQLRVWQALLQVPPGGLMSYGSLAKAIENPNASRAVGSAVGSNPLAFLIPCHRVIRETGIINQYRWGQTRKRAMLAWESTQTNPPGLH